MSGSHARSSDFQPALVLQPAPELQVSDWLNVDAPVRLADLLGRVVVLHAFQMLCPGCVSHGIPQALRIRALFEEKEVAVIGLHTVFEHHAVMTPAALRVFSHEYRLRFPIGIDRAMPGRDIPQTMQALALRGTPSLVVIDRSGCIRLNHFGQAEDMAVGALIGRLVAESSPGRN